VSVLATAQYISPFPDQTVPKVTVFLLTFGTRAPDRRAVRYAPMVTNKASRRTMRRLRGSRLTAERRGKRMAYTRLAGFNTFALTALLCGCQSIFAQEPPSPVDRLAADRVAYTSRTAQASGESKMIDESKAVSYLAPTSITPRQRAGCRSTPDGSNPSQGTGGLPPDAYRPLSAKQKLAFGLKGSVLNPGTYVGSAFEAFFTQRAELDDPSKTRGDNFADGVSRFNRIVARQTTASLLSRGVYPIVFKQDPRYQPSPKRGFRARLLHAAGSTVVAISDAGQLQPNYSNVGGFLTSAALANLYERSTPASRDARGRVLTFNDRVGIGPTFRTFGLDLAFDAAGRVVFDEFQLGRTLGKAFRKLVDR
jgi:hypothetical protein